MTRSGPAARPNACTRWTGTVARLLFRPVRHLDLSPRCALHLVFGFLPSTDLKQAALVSHTFYSHATDHLWQSVNLMDKWHLHVDGNNNHVWGDRGRGVSDEVSTM